MPVQSLFPTPIFIHDFEGTELTAIQAELTAAMPAIRSTKELSTAGGLVETTFKFAEGYVNDIVKHDLKIFHELVDNIVHTYAYNIGYKGNYLKLDGAWTNFFNKGHFYYEHQHLLVKVAGVYYYSTNGADGNLTLQNPTPHMSFGSWPSDGMDEVSMTYPPKVGRLILWPAWLVHRVGLNQTDSERISIGINYN